MHGTVILCFIGFDVHAAERAAIVEDLQKARPGSRVVFRRGDCFSGWVERNVNNDTVVAVDARGFPLIEAAFREAGIASVQVPEPAPPVPVPEPAPPEPAAPKAKK